MQSAASSKKQRPRDVTFSGAEKGQAVTALLAAYAYNDFPLMFDLTDGEVRCKHHQR